MKKVVKVVLLLVAFSFLLHVPVSAESIPDGPWNYVNGVWAKVELPDNNSPWEWVSGHWRNGKWIPGHWKEVEPASGEAVEWVNAYWSNDGKWVHGHWKKVEVVEGKTWVPGHWKNGRWISGHWKGGVIKETKSRVWVSGHRNAAGKWVPGHWVVK
jgi:hypothetical protein